MHHSLEGRCPLLDYRMVEFAFNLPEQLRIKGNISKYLLKQLLYEYIPASYFDRPKWGFAVPMASWLKNELAWMIDDLLSEDSVQQANLVRYEVVQKLIQEFRAGKTYLYNRLWSLILLHQWFRKYGR
jgi:asparagine synthase (glutamine-hydrolysing)